MQRLNLYPIATGSTIPAAGILRRGFGVQNPPALTERQKNAIAGFSQMILKIRELGYFSKTDLSRLEECARGRFPMTDSDLLRMEMAIKMASEGRRGEITIVSGGGNDGFRAEFIQRK